MKVICVKCGKRMELKKIGVLNMQLFENGLPYRLWSADLWQCPDCGTEVLADFGKLCIWEHLESPEPPIETNYSWR